MVSDSTMPVEREGTTVGARKEGRGRVWEMNYWEGERVV